MTRVVYSRRRKSPGTTSGTPLATIFVPRDSTIGGPVRSSNDLAAFVRDRNNELTAARDEEALQKLADGHSDAFLEYAKKRVGLSDEPEEKAYWTRLRDRTAERVIDDNLAQGVKTGSVSLEQVMAHLQTRADSKGKDSPDYGDYIGQIADVKNAILARDFRSRVIDAQAKLVKDGDHQAYVDTLTELSALAKDPAAQKDILDQINTLKTEIGKEKALVQNQADTKILTGYYSPNQTVSAAEAVLYLQKRIDANPTDAAKYLTQIQAIDTRERTLARQAASDGTAAGAKAMAAALQPAQASFLFADQHLQDMNRDKSIPTGNEWKVFTDAATNYEKDLRQAYQQSNLTTAQREHIVTELNRIQDSRVTRKNQAADSVIAKTDAETKRLTDLVDIEKKGADDPNVIAQLRFQAAAKVREAQESPFLSTGQKNTVAAKLDTILKPHQQEIADAAAIVDGRKGDPKYATAVDAIINNYQDLGGAMSEDSVMRALAKGGAPEEVAAAIGLDPDRQESLNAVRKWTSNYKQANDARIAYEESALRRLDLLSASRGADGSVINERQSVAPQERLAYEGAGRIAPMPTGPVGGAPKTAMIAPPGESPFQPPLPDAEPSPESSPLIGQEGDPLSGAQDPRWKAYYGAEDWLSSPVQMPLPTWELPPLPPDSAFAPYDDRGWLDQLPPAPSGEEGELGPSPSSVGGEGQWMGKRYDDRGWLPDAPSAAPAYP